MRIFFSILLLLSTFSLLHSQEIVRGSYALRVEEIRSESALRLTLSDTAGTFVVRIDRELNYDTPRPAVHLFANGSLLVVDSFAGAYDHYDENGQMTRRVPFNREIHPDHERITLLSGNDTTAAVLTSEPGESRSRILVIDERGTIKLDRSLEGAFGSGLLLSPDGRLIAAGTYSWVSPSLEFRTEFLGVNGTSVALLNQEFKGGSWSLQGNLFVVYGRKLATVFDVEKNEIVSTSDLGDNRVVHDILWDDSSPLVVSSPPPKLESGKWIYSQLTVLNLIGQKMTYRSAGLSFRSARLEKNAAGVSVNIDGRSIRIR